MADIMEAQVKCNAIMNIDPVAMKIAGWQPIRCYLVRGHDGEHHGRNKYADFTWLNEEKNPQKENK